MPHPPHARVVLSAMAAALTFAAPTAAAPIRTVAEPIALLSSGPRADCNPDSAPYSPSEIQAEAARATRADTVTSVVAPLPETSTSYLIDNDDPSALVPAARLCSPTLASIPGQFGGAFEAGALLRSRVGIGWRELGGGLDSLAQLVPGDRLTVPAADDAATLQLSVAPRAGAPTTRLSFTDLAPGPSEVTISSDGRGLVAKLTRADGSDAEVTAPAAQVPSLTPRISGSSKRWTITTNQLPKSVVIGYVEDDALFGVDNTEAVNGTASLNLELFGRAKRNSKVPLTLYALSAEAQYARQSECVVTVNGKRRPTSITCSESVLDDIADLFGGSGARQRVIARQFDVARRTYLRLAEARDALGDGATARRTAVTASPMPPERAAQAAAPSRAPITAVRTAQTPSVRNLSARGLKPLAADVNGDGGIDYWTDRTYDYSDVRGDAGVVLTSSAAGLTAHRVVIPAQFAPREVDSDISAIDDITGDGVGELVVDLDERHAIIPGSRSWTGTASKIKTPSLGELGPSDRVAALQLSSPGAPFATLDDATGDGVRELAAADDGGAWTSFSGTAIATGKVTELPSAVRSVVVPDAVDDLRRDETTGVPQVPPATRIIGGRVVALRWPKEATAKSPDGIVAIDVRDAAGRSLRPSIQVTTPGNALLLDYDPPTGDLLLFAASAKCGTSYDPLLERRCQITLLRVGADGNVRQRVTVRPRDSRLALGTARLFADGPDADAALEVVATYGEGSIALLESGRTGTVREGTLPRRVVQKSERRARLGTPLRLFPVLGALGSRRVVAMLPRVVTEGYGRERWRSVQTGAVPAEVRWR